MLQLCDDDDCVLHWLSDDDRNVSMNKTQLINQRVADAIANGERTIKESDTYLQHLLREHPNVCRQTLRYTDTYVLHADPCGCEANDATVPMRVEEATCCYTTQPVGSECYLCGEEI